MVNTKVQYEVSVDGKSYILSSQDYNIFTDCTAKINEILSRASVIEPGKSVSPLPQVNNVAPVKEWLTGETGRRILGDLYDNVVYYNHDTGSWNRSMYNGYPLFDDYIYDRWLNDKHVATNHSKAFKTGLEAMPVFSKLYELVANVTITVASQESSSYSKWASNVKYDCEGHGVLGNLIVRAKVDGRLKLLHPAWFGQGNYRLAGAAAKYGALEFARDGHLFPSFRAALCAGPDR